jgi:hypothetical protein
VTKEAKSLIWWAMYKSGEDIHYKLILNPPPNTRQLNLIITPWNRIIIKG